MKPIQLRPDDDAPVLKPLEGDTSAGKYQLQGEIARGGVGTVLKGFDTQLGRDVAIKLLRDDYLGNPDLLQRFVEEAQIGGQLQHPGIVPVYDLGMQGDQPFFSMKLVKGRTLAALLESRESPDHEPRKYLAIFEQVCHTMAYAHARAVIHRDLKPSNVMVGAFGEVQVVDWGMGKVLGRGGIADETRAQLSVIATVRSEEVGSHSVVGSVMGTPAYMPPEQARGEVEQMDERSDVFALGAVLAEILTGAPPYVGEERIQQAAQAQLDGCYERLDACSADEELKQLARACLAPARMARPKDASALAERIGKYLTSVDDRAEQARLDAAEQEVKTREARRSQKLTIGIAASVLLTLVVGGGGWWWWENKRAQRQADAGRTVQAALDDARVAYGEGNWDAALAVAQKADALAKSDDVAPELRRDVGKHLASVTREHQRAKETAARLARERNTLARLEGIPIPADHEGGKRSKARGAADSRRRDHAYRDTFREFDLPIEKLSIGKAAARIREFERPEAWAAALDDWAMAVETLGADASHLLKVAKAADPDDDRSRLRDMRLRGNAKLADLLKLADAAQDFEPMTAILLAEMLSLRGERKRGIALLSAAHLRRPDDYLLVYRLANILNSGSWKDHTLRDGALRYASVAAALRPRSATAVFMYAVALRTLKRLPEAEAAFKRVIALNKGYAQAYHNLAHVLQDQGKLEEALPHFREAMKDPQANALNCYALALHGLGEKKKAAELWEEARKQLIEERKAAVARGPRDPMTYNNLGAAYGNQGRNEEALEQYEIAIRLDKNLALAWANKGSTLYRLKRIDDAVKALREAVRLDPKDAWTAQELGTILLHREPKEGIKVYRDAIARGAEPRARLHFNLGAWYQANNHLDKAEGQYLEAIAANDSHHKAMTNLSGIYAQNDNLEKAAEFARNAIEAHPQGWRARAALVSYLMAGRNHDQALRETHEALPLTPPQEWAVRYNGACAAAMTGDHAQAAKWLHELLAMGQTKKQLQWWLEDKDLESLRKDDEYADFWREVREKAK